MNNPQELRDLILSALKSMNINTSKMLSDLGFSQSLIIDMKRYNSMPSADKLGAIAQYLNLSTDYLLGLTDKPEINK